MERQVTHGASCVGALIVLSALLMEASAQQVSLQIILTGTPTSLAGFIQVVRVSGTNIGSDPSSIQRTAVTLYGSPELIAAHIPTQGVALRPWKGANPSGALLIFEDRAEDFVIQNSNFWNLRAPALAVGNSTLSISNSSFDQHLRWGPRVLLVNRAAAVTVSGSSFSNANCEGDGGVIHASSGSSLTIFNSKFVNNTASGRGGAIYADTDSQLLSSGTTFSNNSAGSSGGAVYHTGFFPSMTESAATLEIEPQVGANISSYSASAFALLSSNFTANQAAMNGGAVFQEYATGAIRNCQFLGNRAGLYGGALAQGNIFGGVHLSGFQSNTALQGGAMFQMNVLGDIQNVTFSQNVAGATGGGLSRLRCSGDVNSSTFSGDTAMHGGGLKLVRSHASFIHQNAFTGEQVRNKGGGIYARSSVISRVSKNMYATLTASDGAAVYFLDSAVLHGISNNTFTAGIAALAGGAISAVNSTLSNVTFNNFLSNQAGKVGGAVALRNTNATVQGNIFTTNVVSGSANALDNAIFAMGGTVTGAANNAYLPSRGGYMIHKSPI